MAPTSSDEATGGATRESEATRESAMVPLPDDENTSKNRDARATAPRPVPGLLDVVYPSTRQAFQSRIPGPLSRASSSTSPDDDSSAAARTISSPPDACLSRFVPSS